MEGKPHYALWTQHGGGRAGCSPLKSYYNAFQVKHLIPLIRVSLETPSVQLELSPSTPSIRALPFLWFSKAAVRETNNS